MTEQTTTNVHVEQGQIRLSSVVALVDTPTHKVFNIDAHTKYYEVFGGHGQDGLQLMLVKHDGTLRADESTDMPTVVTFDVPMTTETGHWMVNYNSNARYDVEIMFTHVLNDEPSRYIVWSDKD